MMFNLSTKKSLSVLVILGATITGFQNCSNVNFEQDPNSPALDYRFESVGENEIITLEDDLGVNPIGGDGEKQDDVIVKEDDVVKDDYIAKEDEDKKDDDVAKEDDLDKVDDDKKDEVDVVDRNEDKKKDDAQKDHNGKKDQVAKEDKKDQQQGSGLIECQLVESKELVILAQKFTNSRSNSSKTRVCMSREACLTLVNAHVAARDGKLVGAKTTESSTKQCTKEFPGSKGTCNNAAVMTDAQVAEMLASLSN